MTASRRDVESEIRLRFPDVRSARAAVRKLGARRVVRRQHEENVVFDRDHDLYASDRLLRLRTIGGVATLTFKGPRRIRGGIRSRPEFETHVADAGAAARILRGLGFEPTFRYEKFREVFAWGRVALLVDETPIGVFVEVEGPAGEIHRAARAMGKKLADYMTASYAEEFVAAGGRGDMVFRPRHRAGGARRATRRRR